MGRVWVGGVVGEVGRGKHLFKNSKQCTVLADEKLSIYLSTYSCIYLSTALSINIHIYIYIYIYTRVCIYNNML